MYYLVDVTIAKLHLLRQTDNGTGLQNIVYMVGSLKINLIEILS